MAIEVFNRYEKKYIIDEDTFHKLTYQIADYMNPDAYNRNGEAYRISNIYYDTENDQLIRASIEKPIYKEKLRLRAYGTPELTDNVFVEIKKKYISTICSLKFIFHMTDSRTLRKMMAISGLHLIKILRPEGKM